MITRAVESVGAGVISVAREAGGIGVLFGRVIRSLVPPALDMRELWRNLH